MFTRVRKHPRLPTQYIVQCQFANYSEMHEYVLQNISLGGAFIKATRLPDLEARVTLVMALNSGEKVALAGTVVRHQTGRPGSQGFAIKFIASREDMLTRLKSFMDKLPFVHTRPAVKPDARRAATPDTALTGVAARKMKELFGDVIVDKGKDGAQEFALATRLFDSRKFKDACRACFIACQLDKDNAEYATFLGCTLYMLDDEYLDLADYFLFKSLELAPDNAETHLALGYRFKDGGDLQRAIEHFKRSYELDNTIEEARREHDLLSQRLE